MGQGCHLDRMVDVFSRYDLRLMGLLVENGIGQRFRLVEDGYVLVGISTHGNLGLPQGISGTLGLNLVNDFIELQGQILG